MAKRRVASLNYFDLLKVAASFDKNENRGEIRAVARILICFGSLFACPQIFWTNYGRPSGGSFGS